jgi:serine/threonine-protein kinase RsbW
MPTVEVTFTPLPAHVRTARLVATAVARRSGVDEALMDEVRLAVGEACSRAVEAHRRHCPAEPVRIEMTDAGERFVVTVSDHAPTTARAAPAGTGARAGTGGGGEGRPAGFTEVAHEDDGAGAIPAGFGLAVISGLADDVHVSSTSSGVSVRMSWPSAAAPALSPGEYFGRTGRPSPPRSTGPRPSAGAPARPIYGA